MKNKILIIKTLLACALIGCGAGFNVRAQTAPAVPSNLSPELQQVVLLAQKHIGDDVIINYIKNSGKAYKLSADDIIYLNSQGVSQGVISMLQTTTPVNSASPVSNPVATPPADPSSPVPPPLDAPLPAPVAMPPPAMATGLQDNFFADTALNPSLWLKDSSLLAALASMYSYHVLPALAFSPAGMQMSGTTGPGQFTGIQSAASFAPPFNFTASVSGMTQNAIPFEIYLVSADLKQRLTVTGHLGGRGAPRGEIGFGAVGRSFGGGFRIPVGGSSADYGIWLNHTGSGIPISALGTKIFEDPAAGVPYTIQVSAGADGAAAVSLLDPAGNLLAARNVSLGTGPFYVVLAGRNAAAFANWQSVQLTPAALAVVGQPVIPATPTLDYFQAQLTSYGNWIDVPGYGLCWQPAVDSAWRPYYDAGHWEYSDAGWYWQSDYPWGDMVFHYGRWAYTATGWVWVPGYEYAPAWVVWRHADEDGFVGWAPLPPGALFVNGGWEFHHVRVGVDFDFALGANFFTFVAFDHFWEHDFRHFIVPGDRLAFVYRHSVIENRYHLDHGRIFNDGLGRDRVAALTHHDVKVETVRDLRDHEEHRNAIARRDDIHNFKPGAKPDGRRTVDPRAAEAARVAQNHPAARPQPGRNPEPPKGQSSGRGNSPEGGKGENNNSR